jgi:hypothetical protein
MDWVGHHVDIAHWGMGWDDAGPYEVEGEGEYPQPTAIWNSATRYRVTCRYPDGVTMIIAGGHADIRGGTKWIGSEGWVWVNRGKIEAWPPSLLTAEPGPNEIQLPKSEREDHYLEFLKAVKSRGTTLTPTWVSIRSATPGWLGQIAMLTGRKLRWDAEKERILNDADASRLLGREMRIPYRL